MLETHQLSASEQEAFNEGFEAAFNGADESDNKYDQGTNEFLSWNDGFLYWHDMQDQQRREEHRREAKPCTDPTLAKLQGMAPEEVAALINTPLAQWPGRCFQVASLIAKALAWKDAAPVYGLYLGGVSPRCEMFSEKEGAIRHGWILTREGVIVDPTWWVFRASEPKIRFLVPGTDEHFDHASDYDEGAESLSEMSRLFWPEAARDAERFAIDDDELLKRLHLEIQRHHPGVRLGREFTLQQLSWLCRTRYSTWGSEFAHRLYQQVAALGHQAVIPTDFMSRALREKRWAAS